MSEVRPTQSPVELPSDYVYWLVRVPENERQGRNFDPDHVYTRVPCHELPADIEEDDADKLTKALWEQARDIESGAPTIVCPTAYRDGTWSHSISLTREQFATQFTIPAGGEDTADDEPARQKEAGKKTAWLFARKRTRA